MLSEWLLKIIKQSLAGRPCDLLIDRDYMERWYLLPRNRFFNLYFHRFYGSDAPVPHDHPWVSMSWILDGSYVEHTQRGASKKSVGNITLRGAKSLHWIEIDKPVYTLFVTGPRMRRWGFQCEQGWVDFSDYIARRGDSRLASGCGETDSFD